MLITRHASSFKKLGGARLAAGERASREPISHVSASDFLLTDRQRIAGAGRTRAREYTRRKHPLIQSLDPLFVDVNVENVYLRPFSSRRSGGSARDALSITRSSMTISSAITQNDVTRSRLEIASKQQRPSCPLVVSLLFQDQRYLLQSSVE